MTYLPSFASAAKQPFYELIRSLWDRDHYTLYHQMPTTENMQRLVGLAVAEREPTHLHLPASELTSVHRLWDHLSPRSSRANLEEASQYAAATAKYLYERVCHHTGDEDRKMETANTSALRSPK